MAGRPSSLNQAGSSDGVRAQLENKDKETLMSTPLPSTPPRRNHQLLGNWTDASSSISEDIGKTDAVSTNPYKSPVHFIHQQSGDPIVRILEKDRLCRSDCRVFRRVRGHGGYNLDFDTTLSCVPNLFALETSGRVHEIIDSEKPTDVSQQRRFPRMFVDQMPSRRAHWRLKEATYSSHF